MKAEDVFGNGLWGPSIKLCVASTCITKPHNKAQRRHVNADLSVSTSYFMVNLFLLFIYLFPKWKEKLCCSVSCEGKPEDNMAPEAKRKISVCQRFDWSKGLKHPVVSFLSIHFILQLLRTIIFPGQFKEISGRVQILSGLLLHIVHGFINSAGYSAAALSQRPPLYSYCDSNNSQSPLFLFVWSHFKRWRDPLGKVIKKHQVPNRKAARALVSAPSRYLRTSLFCWD